MVWKYISNFSYSGICGQNDASKIMFNREILVYLLKGYSCDIDVEPIVWYA